jgi:AcrR family transcriptional regulator
MSTRKQVIKTARERVLETATRLFYQRGIGGVGIDEIVRESGVTKMTLYKHFGSKDSLAAAFLEKIHAEWSAWFTERVAALAAKAKTPEGKVLAIFDALGEWFETPTFRGCPFINTVSEVSDRNHPARRLAVRFKQQLLDVIAAALLSSGLKKKEDLAEQLLILVDGAVIRALMTDSSRPARVARKAAGRLLERRYEDRI